MKLKALFLAAVLAVSASATSTLGLYCEDKDVNLFSANNEYINSSTNWVAGAIPSTLKYNKKTGTHTIWVTFITQSENQNAINMGVGYTKQFKEINLKANKTRVLSTVIYRCDGTQVESFGAEEWYHVVPNSLDEDILSFVKSIK